MRHSIALTTLLMAAERACAFVSVARKIIHRLLLELRNSADPRDMDVFFDTEEAHAVMLAYAADRGPVDPRFRDLDHRERAGSKHLPSTATLSFMNYQR
jgi:hypothetical protein